MIAFAHSETGALLYLFDITWKEESFYFEKKRPFYLFSTLIFHLF